MDSEYSVTELPMIADGEFSDLKPQR